MRKLQLPKLYIRYFSEYSLRNSHADSVNRARSLLQKNTMCFRVRRTSLPLTSTIICAFSSGVSTEASNSKESDEIDLNDYEALLLEAIKGEEMTNLSSSAKCSGDEQIESFSSHSKTKTSQTAMVPNITKEIIDTVKDLLPVDGTFMRLTDLTPCIDLEMLEDLPPPPGARSVSFLQFLQSHPTHFQVLELEDSSGTVPISGTVKRWCVQRADKTVGARYSSKRIPAPSGATASSGSACLHSDTKGASNNVDVDCIDLEALLLEEEMRNIQNSSSSVQRKAQTKASQINGSAKAPAPSPNSAKKCGKRLKPVEQESGHHAAAQGSCNTTVSAVDASEETIAVWKRIAALLEPHEILPVLQLRTRVEENDPELLEWGRSGSSGSNGGEKSIGLRRLLWKHKVVAERFLDFDAESGEGWVARAGVFESAKKEGRIHNLWSKGNAEYSQQSNVMKRDEQFAEAWEVDLNLDEEENILENDLVSLDEDALERPTAGSPAEKSNSSLPQRSAMPKLTKKQRRKQQEEASNALRSLSPEALLQLHTSVANQRGWVTPATILDFLVECIPTFPVPVSELVLSDGLIKLFGLKVTMHRLVMIYSYYVVYDKDAVPGPTVCLDPTRVVGVHPHAGKADKYYKNWKPIKGGTDLGASKLDTDEAQSSSTARARSKPLFGGFAPLKRTIKSEVKLPHKSSSKSTMAKKNMPVSAAALEADKNVTPRSTGKQGSSLERISFSSSDGSLKKAPLSSIVIDEFLKSAPPCVKGDGVFGEATSRARDLPHSNPNKGLSQSSFPSGGQEIQQALRYIYDPSGIDSRTLDNADPLLVLIRAILKVPYTHFISLEEVALRCSCNVDVLEDLLDRAQPIQARYAGFLLHSPPVRATGEGRAASRTRRRRLVRLRPLWMVPNSTGDLTTTTGELHPLASVPRLPPSFLKKLLPTWRPLERVLESIPSADRDAMQAAAESYSSSLGHYLQLFGRSSCWIDEQFCSGKQTESGVSPQVVSQFRVRRYTGQLEMDDIESLGLRALFYCCRTDEFQSLETLIKKAQEFETAARQRYCLNDSDAMAKPGEGLAHMLAESPIHVKDFCSLVVKHTRMFELESTVSPSLTLSTANTRIKRRNLFAAFNYLGRGMCA